MIEVNGVPVAWEEGLTVRGALRARNFIFPLLVVDLDGAHVDPADYDRTPVPDGARIQAMHLISGG